MINFFLYKLINFTLVIYSKQQYLVLFVVIRTHLDDDDDDNEPWQY